MSKKYGILIGINDYASNPLDYCVNDVISIEKILINNCEFNENNLRIITSQNENLNIDIEELFKKAVENIKNDFIENEDSLFFFFSGHGIYQDEATLMFHKNQIKVSQIYSLIKKTLNPKNLFYVFDACHSGEKIKSHENDFMNELYWNKLSSKSESITIIAAARYDQKATEKRTYENGTLTHHFIRSINTKQNYNDLGFLTPSNIADFVRKEVSLDRNFNQIPYTESKDVGSYAFAFNKYLNTGSTKRPKEIEISKSIIRTAPTVLFYQRLSKSFPGVRGLKWFKGKNAIDGLTRFLKEPLIFDDANGYGTFKDPLWWFRGGSAMPITKYQHLEKDKVLLNNDELKIEKIAVFNANSYYSSFIYIQTSADTPCVTKLSTSKINEYIDSMGYFYEAFGIFKDHIVTAEEYEDGAAIINGEYTELNNCKFRNRYLSEYNIILVPKSSPHNTRIGNLLGAKYMNAILKGEKTLEEFIKEYTLLPRNPLDK